MQMPMDIALEELEYEISELPPSQVSRIAADRVAVGMYVCQLDCPWTMTPFPPGGLLIESAEQAAKIAAVCRTVSIDAALSEEAALPAIHAAERELDGAVVPVSRVDEPQRPVRRAGAPRPPRKPPKVDEEDRRQLRALLLTNSTADGAAARGGVLRRFLGRLGKPAKPSGSAAGSRGDSFEQLRAEFRDLVGTYDHPAFEPMRATIPAARQALAQADAITLHLFSRARNSKPVSPERIHAAGVALAECAVRNPEALMWCNALRAQVPGAHRAPTTATLMLNFARHLRMHQSAMVNAALIGLLADVGNALLQPGVIESEGRLSSDEFEHVKSHVALGLKYLAGFTALPDCVIRGISEHHERFDGSGYPAGRHGEEISLHGAMIAIVDCYCALTTPRAFANAISAEDALAFMVARAGSGFHPALVAEFARCIGFYPVGGMVELIGGEVAVIADRNPVDPLSTRVSLITGPNKGPLRWRQDEYGETVDPIAGYSPARLRIVRGLPSCALGLSISDCWKP